MAWNFDESNDYALVTDAAALTLPNADWSMGLWLKLADNTGGTFQYFLSWGTVAAIPSMNCYFSEASSGAPQGNNVLNININNAPVWSSVETIATSTAWQHLCFRRNGTTLEVFQNGVQLTRNTGFGSGTFSAGTDVSGNLYVGGRNDLNTGRFFGGHMAELFKIDRLLAASEITSLANGSRPDSLQGIHASTSWYLPMLQGGTGGDYAERINQLTVTNSDSTNAANHAPVSLYGQRFWGATVPEIGATSPPATSVSQMLLLGVG